MRSISVQSLLFSEVIKKSIDLSVSDSYLLPPPLVLCFVLPSGSPGRKVCFTDAERTALCCCTVHVSNDRQTSNAKANVRIERSFQRAVVAIDLVPYCRV